MASIFLIYTSDGACTFHRLLQPARFCAPDFAPLGHVIDVGDGFPEGYDWIALTGLPTPTAILEVARCKHRGQKFLWSLDDDFLSIPDWNPAKPKDMHALSVWQMAKEMADLILCSTPALAATFADVSEKVMTAPNMIDLSTFPYWSEAQGERTVSVTLPIRVCWVGGITHRMDTEILVEPVDAILKRFPRDELQVVWFGALPPHKLLRDHLHRGLVYNPPSTFPNYQGTLNSLRPDVYMAPLDPCDFNLSKSNLRVLEAWGMQAVPVASPHGEYACVRPGIDGRLAGGSEEWISSLSRVISDHAYRTQMALDGRQRVGLEYDWNRFACRRPWHELFARVFGCDLPREIVSR
jgi:glycosyltransferase involved in cell wall biosynthesis